MVSKVVMVDEITGLRKTGLTVTAERSIDGGPFVPCAREVHDAGWGEYTVQLEPSEVIGSTIAVRFMADGALLGQAMDVITMSAPTRARAVTD